MVIQAAAPLKQQTFMVEMGRSATPLTAHVLARRVTFGSFTS
ncbi:hypothetical protein SB861_16460 [Paraburkholderia sp. SIMBA_049]|jgi:hypothetical protein